MRIIIPDPALVVLVGPSGAGKTTFARRHFGRFEVLSSDRCRGLVADDEADQSATSDAFDVLHYIAARRLRRGRLVVVDATSVRPEARRPLIALAREYGATPVAIVFDLPEPVHHERIRNRSERVVGEHVIRRQAEQLRHSLTGMEQEGFREVYVLRSTEQVAAVEVVRETRQNSETADVDSGSARQQ
jgi:protein phosphatase